VAIGQKVDENRTRPVGRCAPPARDGRLAQVDTPIERQVAMMSKLTAGMRQWLGASAHDELAAYLDENDKVGLKQALATIERRTEQP
jgi:hypothetical protein